MLAESRAHRTPVRHPRQLEALDACLAHARARGADEYALLGDFVGYGADAVAVVDHVMRFADGGRHRREGQPRRGDRPARQLLQRAGAGRARLGARIAVGPEQKRFLAELPLVGRARAVVSSCTRRRRLPSAGTTSTAQARRCAAPTPRASPTRSAVTCTTRCSTSRRRERPHERIPAVAGNADPRARSAALACDRRLGRAAARPQSCGGVHDLRRRPARDHVPSRAPTTTTPPPTRSGARACLTRSPIASNPASEQRRSSDVHTDPSRRSDRRLHRRMLACTRAATGYLYRVRPPQARDAWISAADESTGGGAGRAHRSAW